ncbi:translin-associated factor X-interacting protein 1-like isoform X1 [Aricia agestis]|nr:translin-associated factor X-interacting protein 1-like isoform X1 [Aricia agestis]
MGKRKDDQFSDYLLLMRERDARYTLYFENVALHLKLKELDGTSRGAVEYSHGDPVVLRIALDRCREQLSTTQTNLKRMMEEYSETVPRRDHEALETKHCDLNKTLDAVRTEYEALQNAYRRLVGQKKSMEEELLECQERCRELERSGTPRPRWEVCADFIGGGRDRWRQLADGLSSRERLLVLLKELGPAAESEHLEYFDGLGTDPSIPAYLRHSGRVRNLRLSRRELSVIINDIWRSKRHATHVPMQDFVTRYFEERYQQPSVRAEWAYNVCAGAEQTLDEAQARLWWGALTAALDERVYWALRRQWDGLRDACGLRGQETISLEEFEKAARALFPLKSEVDIKNLTDVVKRQLKLKLNHTEIHLDKLFYESEEGFDRTELARELYRQRQQAQDKYLRELLAELAPRRPHPEHRAVSVDALKRAFAIIDPAIDHIRMERYIRWAFSDQTSDLSSINPLPLRTIITRLASGDIERVGPRQKGARKIKI